MAQMYHVNTSLFRLTVLRDPAWDRGVVRQTVDILSVLDQMAELFDGVPEAMGWDVDSHADNVFPMHSKMVRTMRSLLAAEINAIEAPSAELEVWRGQPHEQTAAGMLHLMGAGHVDVPMALTEDQWWGDIFGPWEAGI
jgi:hypothetical protein